MFDVAHDNAHPFKVAAGAVTVTDVGTVFDVERIMDATEVRVFRGAVSVAVPSARQRSLKAGEWLILDPDHGAVQGQFDPVVYQSWRTDWLQAENMPLKYAIARLNRYSPERISLGDASKAEATLNGRFNLRNTDGTLQMISALLKLKTVRRGGGLSLEDARSN
jgi:transmembrane sensor